MIKCEIRFSRSMFWASMAAEKSWRIGKGWGVRGKEVDLG
jgi:hypothetical protein